MATDILDNMKEAKPKARRPMMALVTKHMKKKEAEALLERPISKYEWDAARMHARYPGPLVPVEPIKYTRRRFKLETLLEFLGYLDDNQLQNHAFGDLDYKASNGDRVQLDAVSTVSSVKTIVRDYHNAPSEGACSSNQCSKRCPKSNNRCCLIEGHETNCQFTAENKLSASTLERIIGGITRGQLKSLAGLDDEDTLKGRNSIERLLEIYTILSNAMDLCEEETKQMRGVINHITDFHKTDFHKHLERTGERSCQCISCGLHSSDEPTACTSEHKGPCKECEDSLQVFSDMIDLAKKAQSIQGIPPEKKEQYFELQKEIEKCRKNLIDWRSHIVRKKVESGFSRDEISSLQPDEAIVVSDFKMKILPMYFRENQRKFFGKRGTACLGFMVLTNAEGKDGEVDVHFFFFFSNDTTADTNFVLAGKSYIYSEFLPKELPEAQRIKVRFESDGAAAFNSNTAKACMPYWSKWTNGRVEEVQIRHSVNGDGKSPLDGAFGKLGANLREAVNDRCTDITNAETCLDAYQKGAGIKGATGAILEPLREDPLHVSSTIPKLLSSHRLLLDRERGVITGYSCSGYGEGIDFPLGKIENMWSSPPEMPRYIITEQVPTIKSSHHSVHSTESHQSRVKKFKTSKRAAAKKRLEEVFRTKRDEAKSRSVFCCDACHPFYNDYCRRRFFSQDGLDRHMGNGAHEWMRGDIVDMAAELCGREGGILAAGSKSNRSEEYNNMVAVDGTGAGVHEGEEWYAPGCYRKPGRASSKRWKEQLKKELIRMFDDGEKRDTGPLRGRNKYTPDRACKELREMTLASGLKMFSSTSEHGPLPTVDQIRAFWGRLKKKREKENEARNAKRAETELEDHIDQAAVEEWVTDAFNTAATVGDESVFDWNTPLAEETEQDDIQADSVPINFAPGMHGAVNNKKLLSKATLTFDGEFNPYTIDELHAAVKSFGGKSLKSLTSKTSECT